MAVKSGTFSTSSADYSGMKYHKKIYFNKKSFTAMFLSAALLLTSVDCMKVQAEELADQVLPTQTQESGSVSDNTLPVADAATEPDYVKTPEGAVIITSFEALSEDASHFELGEEETLEEAAGRMPATLKASAEVYVAQNKPDAGDDTADEPGGDEESTPGAGDEEQPDDEENTPGAGDEEQPGDGEGNGGEEPGEGEGSGEEEPGEGEGSGGEPGEGDSGDGDSGEQPGDSGDGGNDEQPGDGGDSGNGEQPGDGGDGGSGEQPGDSGDGGNDEQPGDNGGDGSGDQSGDSGSDNGQPEGGKEQSDDSAESQPDAETQSQENDGGNEDAQAEPTDTAKAKINSSFALQDGHQWRLLVATDENIENTDKKEDKGGESGEESNNGSGDGQQPDGGDAGGNGGGQSDEGGSGENGGDDQQPSGGDAEGNGGSGQPDEGGSGENGGDDQQPGGGDAEGNGGSGQPDEGGSGENGGDGQQPVGGDGGSGQPGEGGEGENGGTVQPGEGDGQPGGDQPGADTPADGQPGADAAPGTDGQPGEDTPAADGDAGTTDPAQPTEKVEVEVPVQWECKDADNEEATEYIFRPTWNETVDGTGDKIAWFFDGSENDIPTITVTRPEVALVSEITTEEELVAAFAAGLTPLTLKNDIELTAPLVLPETAIIELDGQGHSLLRGTVKGEGDDAGGVFTGTMIYMDGEKYTRDLYGTLTLKNITVNGELTGDVQDAGAPVILDSGSLILDIRAVVRDNRNCGTTSQEGSVDEIEPYGGGIRVSKQGKLTAAEMSQVTGNYAEELGGGVYLGNGSTLYLYADVIKGNAVPPETGKGLDIYAVSGSTIYYAASVDIEAMKEQNRLFAEDGVNLLPLRKPGDEEPPEASKKEIYINVSEDSGYSEAEVLKLRNALIDLGYTVISNRIYIDPTKLDDWYVYDHYDKNAWDALNENWEDVYGADNPKRKYYEYNEPQGQYWKEANPAYTIEDWLNKVEEGKYGGNTGALYLAQFKEHIYSRKVDGYPAMTFVGYGHPAFVDFLFYDPESDGEKVVDFDVDSSRIYTHTLKGTGFLVNTRLEEGKLYGFLVYYSYVANGNAGQANSVKIYQLNGIEEDSLHGVDAGFSTSKWQALLGNPLPDTDESIDASEWDNNMSIQIKASPGKIEVRQKKTAEGEFNDSDPAIISYTYDENSVSAGNAYGPLVAYTSDGHTCERASAFTYSNLRMYYTNPEDDPSYGDKDMLSPLERADYTQNDTQKYFVNLFGKEENREYGDDPKQGDFQEYLDMMQQEGIALITDRETPFEDYLGKPGEKDSNLFELERGGGMLSVDDLVKKIDEIIKGKDPQSTSVKELITQNPGDGGLEPAEPSHSIGNIWLKSVLYNDQFREVPDALIGENGYAVQIMDDITYYHGAKEGLTVTYEILKPRKSGYTELFKVTPSEGSPGTFVIGKDKSEWPLGQYTVRQTISDGTVVGYAYFNLTSRPSSAIPSIPLIPATPTPPEPEDPDPPTPPKPEEPDPPVDPDPEPPGPVKPNNPPKKPSKKPSSSSGGFEPAAVEPYVEETIEVAAGEPVSVAAPAPAPAAEEPEEKNPNEPRTGDMPVATMPVSVGACTAFMMKLRLWLYELETGISEEKKNEILRTLVGWAKGRAMIRVYLAIAATAVVLTAYHLLRALDARRRQVVEWFGR